MSVDFFSILQAKYVFIAKNYFEKQFGEKCFEKNTNGNVFISRFHKTKRTKASTLDAAVPKICNQKTKQADKRKKRKNVFVGAGNLEKLVARVVVEYFDSNLYWQILVNFLSVRSLLI